MPTDDENPDEGTRPEADLRVARKERDDAMALMQQLLRREAARDAGLDLNNPQQRFFVDKYDGDVDKMQEQAKALGFIKERPDPNLDALGRMTQTAAGGGTQPTTVDTAQRSDLLERAKQLMEKAKTRQGSVREVDQWARDAGVPFVGEDD